MTLTNSMRNYNEIAAWRSNIMMQNVLGVLRSCLQKGVSLEIRLRNLGAGGKSKNQTSDF